MNKEQALKWLVDDVKEWPKDRIRYDAPRGWAWENVSFPGNGVGLSNGDDCLILQSSWEAAKAQEAKAWDGEGLPPVGAVCEFRATRGKTELYKKWSLCRVVFRNEANTVIEMDGLFVENFCHMAGQDVEFRPIQSEADKLRESAADAICDSTFAHDIESGEHFEVSLMHGRNIHDAITSGEVYTAAQLRAMADELEGK